MIMTHRDVFSEFSARNLIRSDAGHRKYSLRTFSECQPFRDAEVLDRHIEGLRKAGLPE